MRKALILFLAIFFLPTSRGAASICNFHIDPIHDDVGMLVSKREIEFNDKRLIDDMSKFKTVQDKVRTYLDVYWPISLEPLVAINDSAAVLETLMDFANDMTQIYRKQREGETKAEYEDFKSNSFKRIRAIIAIGRFCDRKAGQFLLSGIKNSAMPSGVKWWYFIAISNVSASAEWKGDLQKAFADDSYRSITESDPRYLGSWIVAMGRVGGKKQLSAVIGYESYLNEAFGPTLNEGVQKAAYDAEILIRQPF